MSEWKKVRLGDISIDGGHYGIGAAAVEYDESLPTYLRITDIREDGSIIHESLKSVDDPNACEYYLKPNDLVIARTGASTGRNYFYDGRDGKLVYAGFLIRFSIDSQKIWPPYVKYWFQGSDYKTWLLNHTDGSTRANINAVTLGECPIYYPVDVAIQRRIAAVLSSLDDKIENNRKICANLEAQAQAIFKSWFVDFEPFGGKMPQGWKMGKLGDVLQRIGTGLNPRKNFVLGKGKNFYVTIKNMGNNRIYLDEKCDKVDDDAIQRINERSDLKVGDVLFSGIGTIGRTYLIPETPTNWNTSESVFNMRVTEGVPPEFLYLFLLSDRTQEYVQLNALGSAQKGIRMADLKVCPCVIPTQEWLHKFSELVKPSIKAVQEKWQEMDSLAALRDALLPKLMSGEIDVEKVEVA